MDPIKLTEYSRKYGSPFLMWCVIFYLFNDLRETKNDLREVQSKLYTCLEIRSDISKNISEEDKSHCIQLAIIPKKQRYAVKGSARSLEV